MVNVKIAKQTDKIKSVKVEKAIEELAKLKQVSDDANDQMKAHKETIIEEARKQLDGTDIQTISFGVSETEVKVSFSYDIKIQDEDNLLALLGDRYYDLTTEKKVISPTTKLKEMALEDDGLSDYMSIKEKAPAVSVKKL